MTIRKSDLTVGIVAPSNQIPWIEFELGLEKLRSEGIRPVVHSQCKKKHLIFAGNDEQRAQAFFEFAHDPRFSVLWCARGGYGAARLLPHLDRLSRSKGVPPAKLLVGYSDVTAFFEYVRLRWNWKVLHAPMPAMRRFCLQTPKEWSSLIKFVRQDPAAQAPWDGSRLQWIGKPTSKKIEAQLVGGNLAVWTSLVGTRYEGSLKGKILFLEDVDEPLYRLDRMLGQLTQSPQFQGVKAVVLGNFLSCRDTVAQVLARKPRDERESQMMLDAPKPSDFKPLRKKLDDQAGLKALLAEIQKDTRVPMAYGLPVGHGPGIAALPIGAKYQLGVDGRFRLLSWK